MRDNWRTPSGRLSTWDDFEFDFSPLMASDLAGRARAFGQMVKGGMDVEKAARLTKPFGDCRRWFKVDYVEVLLLHFGDGRWLWRP